MEFNSYHSTSNFDEMFDSKGHCREHYSQFLELIKRIPEKKLSQLQFAANKTQMAMGMTFNVYHDNQGIEKILHLDIIPRIIPGSEWKTIEAGLQ